MWILPNTLISQHSELSAFAPDTVELNLELKELDKASSPLLFVRSNPTPLQNLLVKMENGSIPSTPIWSNLKTFPMEEFHGCVDLITGGFPCQPFSVAGSRNGSEDPRHLFPYFKKFMEVVKPKHVFMENVDGIASSCLSGNQWTDPEGTPVLLHVCREMERLGYKVATGCFTAEEVGAPHGRKRWFIYGELDNTNGSGLEGSWGRGQLQETSQECSERGYSQGIQCNGSESAMPGEPKEQEFESGDPNWETIAGELGNTQYFGLLRHKEQGCSNSPSIRDEKGQNSSLQSSGTSGSYHLQNIPRNFWPAPPGDYQHPGEEPRTIPNSKDIGCRGWENHAHGSNTNGIQEHEEVKQSVVRGQIEGCSGNGEAKNFPPESQLGRTVDGDSSGMDSTSQGVDAIANRIERLKMCGNGVVPQTATRAWITLRFMAQNGHFGKYPNLF